LETFVNTLDFILDIFFTAYKLFSKHKFFILKEVSLTVEVFKKEFKQTERLQKYLKILVTFLFRYVSLSCVTQEESTGFIGKQAIKRNAWLWCIYRKIVFTALCKYCKKDWSGYSIPPFIIKQFFSGPLVCCWHLKIGLRSCVYGRHWCCIFYCHWWTTSIKPRLVFSHALDASWGICLFLTQIIIYIYFVYTTLTYFVYSYVPLNFCYFVLFCVCFLPSAICVCIYCKIAA